ncbi:MAG: hypothetical protein ACOX3W_08410 [Christensenellaceae bacterium]
MKQKSKKIVSFLLVFVMATLLLATGVASAYGYPASTMSELLEGERFAFYVGEELNVFDSIAKVHERLGHLNTLCFRDLKLEYVGDSAQYYEIDGKMVTGLKVGVTKIKITGVAECYGFDIFEDPVNGEFEIEILRSPDKPVEELQNVPTAGKAGEPLELTGKVEPVNATYQDVIWEIADSGNTGASIKDGNILETQYGGAVVVRATIKDGIKEGEDWVKEFTITIEGDKYVGVTDIPNIPSEIKSGVSQTLPSTVTLEDGSTKEIVWSIKEDGSTGSVFENGVLKSTRSGTVVVQAVVKDGLGPGVDYVKEVVIKVIQQAPSTGDANTLAPLFMVALVSLVLLGMSVALKKEEN